MPHRCLFSTRTAAALAGATALCALLTAACTEPGDSFVEVRELEMELAPEVQQAFVDAGCYNCHSDSALLGGFSLQGVPDEIPMGQSGVPILIPCEPEMSLLFQKITCGDMCPPDVPGAPMPLGGMQMPPADIETVRAWIAQGAQVDSCP